MNNQIESDNANYYKMFLSKVFDEIVQNYYIQIEPKMLYSSAVEGMTNSLDKYSKIWWGNERQEQKIKGRNVEASILLDSIGLLRIKSFDPDIGSIVSCLVDSLLNQGVTKLILDLRDNFGGSIDSLIDVCNILIPEGLIFYSVDKFGKKREYYSHLHKEPFSSIFVLVNSNTMSAAEMLAATVGLFNGIIIGERTFGKAVSQITRQVFGGYLQLTNKAFFLPNGYSFDGDGISPDIELSDMKLMKEPEVIEQVIEIIHGKEGDVNGND